MSAETRDDAAPAGPLLVTADATASPAWAAGLGARAAAAAALEGARAAALLGGVECAMLDATDAAFVNLARRLHAADPNLQVIVVTPPEHLQATRRALLYAPGLGEVWVASPTEVGSALAERAAGVTRQRRRFARTRTRIDRERLTASPQRTERALISDAYLAGLLRVLPDPVFSVNDTGRVLSANEAARSAFTGRNAGLVGAQLGELLELTPGEDDRALLRRAARDGHVTLRFARADGAWGIGELRAAALTDASPAAGVWAVVLRDITEQQATQERLQDTAAELEASNEELQGATDELLLRTEQAERAAEALAESEATYRALVDALPALAWSARADGYIDWYNQRWYDYTGTTPQQMAGWGWQSVHDPSTLPSVIERWQASITTGAPFEMTFPLRGVDGVFRAFLTRAVPLRDAAGRVTRWFGTNTDVEAERAARARIERLQELTEVLASARSLDEVAASVVARMVEASGAATGMLAMRIADTEEGRIVQTSGVPQFVAERFTRFSLSARIPVASCIRTGAPAFVESRDGEEGLFARYPEVREVWERLGTHAIATVPLAVAGDIVGAMTFTFTSPRRFTRDDRAFFLAFGRQCAQAVERARLFAAEREARQRADEANRAKSQFLANMSHELRTPLNAIGGYVQLMELGLHGPVTEAQAGALDRVQRSQRHLLGLINEVLNFAKLETGSVHYAIAAVRVCDVLDEAETLVAPQASARELDLVVTPCADDLVVLADAEKLRQIVVNLLSNAVKFTGSGGRITLWGERREHQVLVCVRDTGCGIPADKLEAIFEPFVQVRADLTRTAEGAGLGLAISRDLARGMGGELTVASVPGAGSTFTLALPGVDAAAEADPSRPIGHVEPRSP
ncbi:MAG TPA: ATP-binding protein [Gemmatimonadaceae bacterium]|nr:ATP-binding protein [Gemmatimonadaceae bacterium]